MFLQVCYKKREFTDQVQYSLGCIDKEVRLNYVEHKRSASIFIINLKQYNYVRANKYVKLIIVIINVIIIIMTPF